jgi:hypothetical protein
MTLSTRDAEEEQAGRPNLWIHHAVYRLDTGSQYELLVPMPAAVDAGITNPAKFPDDYRDERVRGIHPDKIALPTYIGKQTLMISFLLPTGEMRRVRVLQCIVTGNDFLVGLPLLKRLGLVVRPHGGICVFDNAALSI